MNIRLDIFYLLKELVNKSSPSMLSASHEIGWPLSGLSHRMMIHWHWQWMTRIFRSAVEHGQFDTDAVRIKEDRKYVKFFLLACILS